MISIIVQSIALKQQYIVNTRRPPELLNIGILVNTDTAMLIRLRQLSGAHRSVQVMKKCPHSVPPQTNLNTRAIKINTTLIIPQYNPAPLRATFSQP